MNDAPASAPAPEFAGPMRRENWTPTRWFVIIAVVFALHVALIFVFGEKKTVVPRMVKNVPRLNLIDNTDERLRLDDPTLFVLPNPNDFGSAFWLQPPGVQSPPFRWTEPPRPLPLSADSLGVAFSRLMQTNFSADRRLNFKSTPELNIPTLLIEPSLPASSTMQMEGELARRQLPATVSLTNWPFADVLAPCVVQVLVDSAGNVLSSVLLTPCGYSAADQRALEIARALRFKPAPRVTLGRVTFNWQTVPPVETP